MPVNLRRFTAIECDAGRPYSYIREQAAGRELQPFRTAGGVTIYRVHEGPGWQSKRAASVFEDVIEYSREECDALEAASRGEVRA
ncbi:MAG TPA: hypothetical protein VGK73_27870 [Polyangiaceae bacterium]